MGTLMCKDSNEDEWIYVIRTGSCRVIKALTQVTPKLRTRKKAQVIYDSFGTKRVSQYSIEALGAFSKVKKNIRSKRMFYRNDLSFQPRTSIKPAKCYTEIEQIRERAVFVRRYSHSSIDELSSSVSSGFSERCFWSIEKCFECDIDLRWS